MIIRLLLLFLAVLLPWRITFRILRYRAAALADGAEASAALAAAQAYLSIPCADTFRQRFALYRLVDDVDLAIGWTRGRAWRTRWLRIQEGTFPQKGAFLALTFHLGAGVPALWELGRHDKGVAWIHAPAEHVAGSGLAFWLARMRIKMVVRLAGAPTISTGGARGKAECWLKTRGGIVALVDAPHFGRREVTNVQFLGRTVGLPCGLAKLALTVNAPVYLFSSRLSFDSGHRLLRVIGPLATDRVDMMMQEVATFLEEEARSDPAAWHFWELIERGFPASDEGSSRMLGLGHDVSDEHQELI